MKNNSLILLMLVAIYTKASAQIDSSLIRKQFVDSSKNQLNMDAVYNRPFLTMGKTPVSIGGYAEVNWQHIGTDGISEGHQFQMRRMTLFIASSINKRLKFLTEIEFEDGTKEIAIEFASIDLTIHPLLNFRSGIMMNPIGAFNQNHDGPKWEFTDRPISASQMLPATWSNAGFGVFGKMYKGNWMFGYESYLSGGFDNSIINNEQNKTFLPAAKLNPNRFEASASGTPLTTVKLAVKNMHIGELGLSAMRGVYNTFNTDGINVDKKRFIQVFAFDVNFIIPRLNTNLIGEWAWIQVDVPITYSQQYGNCQRGGFLDIVQPIYKGNVLDWPKAVVNIACRLDYVDWNVGTFNETKTDIGEDLMRVATAIAFRPVAETVFRLNYIYQLQRDIFGNYPSKTGGLSFGLSTYF